MSQGLRPRILVELGALEAARRDLGATEAAVRRGARPRRRASVHRRWGRLAAVLLACLAGVAAAQEPRASDFPMLDPTLGPAPGWKAGAPLPERLQGTVVVSTRSRDAVGVFNAPSCQVGEWTLTADLSMTLASKNGEVAEYQASSGRWKVAGTCRGFFTQDFPDDVCTVTVDGRDEGAGSFAGAAGSARLTFHRDTGVFELGLEVTGKSTRAWRYVCAEQLPWPKARTETAETAFVAGVNGHVLVRERHLVFDVSGTHTWTSKLIDGLYTRTSGGFLGSGPDCEYLRKQIERVQKELDQKRGAAQAQQRALLASDPGALAEVAGAATQGTIPPGLDAVASAAIQKEMAALPGVGGGDGEAYFRSLSGYLEANPMPLPLPLDPAMLPALGQGQAFRSSLAMLGLDGRGSVYLLEELRKQLDRCRAGK